MTFPTKNTLSIRAGRLTKADPIKYENKCKDLRQQSEQASEAKKPEKPKIEIVRSERQKDDDYFLPLERDIIQNESYRKLFKGPGIVFQTPMGQYCPRPVARQQSIYDQGKILRQGLSGLLLDLQKNR